MSAGGGPGHGVAGAEGRWRVRRYAVPAEREDDAVAVLWQAGATGFEVRAEAGRKDPRLELAAWFPESGPAEIGLPDPASFDGELLGEETVRDRDWLAEHRRVAEPFDLGRGFRVDPGDPEPANPEPADPAAGRDRGKGPEPALPRESGSQRPGRTAAGGVDRGRVDRARSASVVRSPDGHGPTAASRRLLRIPARTAFGTGSHESTRLAVRLLEELDLRGRSVLDVGTGSGILCFVALALGASRAVGFDVDPAAPPVARENGRVNGLAARVFAGRVAALAASARFDVVVANALPWEVADEMDGLVGRLTSGGVIVLSGIPLEREDEVCARLVAAGAEIRRSRRDGEWVALEAGPTGGDLEDRSG